MRHKDLFDSIFAWHFTEADIAKVLSKGQQANEDEKEALAAWYGTQVHLWEQICEYVIRRNVPYGDDCWDNFKNELKKDAPYIDASDVVFNDFVENIYEDVLRASVPELLERREVIRDEYF